ncbi:cysteine desulfurase family protein [Lignipirellula cremea]|uniref:Cysteine desulfurase n=1 Tax=Lignipirellula cremea TaxID=2528010 RepID=A0A518E585_9BACT|nr:cysteine desulfurase family protein [Lignipirellula cremea]QDU99265.1 Cysteine desulfurase [Lignipirellula cremea]
MQRIYLDHNATTPLAAVAAAAMAEADRKAFANPASQHEFGRKARRRLETAREAILAELGGQVHGMQHDHLVFTSGGTEANNLALLGLAGAEPGTLLISAIEHPSVTAAALLLQRRGFEVEKIGVCREGVVDLAALEERLQAGGDVRLVSIMLGNNETGVLQPVREAAQLCRAAGVPLHTDAVQAVGKIGVDFRGLGVSALSFAAHKFHGPRGIGGLLLRNHLKLEPQLAGGFQQAGLRPGTEPVSLAVGMAAALAAWRLEANERTARLAELRDLLEAKILLGAPDTIRVGGGAARLPHTSNLAFPGQDRQALQMALDMAGVACSTGSACASGSSEPSPVLQAMGLPQAVVEGSLRFSLGADTRPVDVERAADCILRVINNLRQQNSRRK